MTRSSSSKRSSSRSRPRRRSGSPRARWPAASDPSPRCAPAPIAFLAVCAEPEIERIILLDAPAVLGWERWREIGFRHGLGLIVGVLQAGMDAGVIAQQPITPLAHLLLGAMDEGALYIARSEDPETARAEVEQIIDRLIAGLAP